MLEELENKVALCDIDAKYIELDNNNEILGSALMAIEELSDIAAILDKEVISKDALQMASVATESICNRLGYNPRDKIVPSLESLSIAARANASKVALEKIGDTIGKIWEAIKSFFRRILEGIKSLWAKINETIEVNDKYITHIDERIAEIKERKQVIRERIIDVTVHCNTFNTSSVGDLPRCIKRTLDDHTDILKRRPTINKDIEKLLKSIPGIKTTEEAVKLAEELNPLKHIKATTYADGLELRTTVRGAEGIVHISLARHTNELKYMASKPMTLDKLERVLLEIKRFRKVVDEQSDVAEESEAIIKAAVISADELFNNNETDYTLSRIRAKLFESGQESLFVISNRLPKAGMGAYLAAISYMSANLRFYADPR